MLPEYVAASAKLATDYPDNAVVGLSLVGAGTDSKQAVETATCNTTLIPNAQESMVDVDSGRVQTVVNPASSDTYFGPDLATVKTVFAPGAQESATVVDSGSGSLSLSGSSLPDTRQSADSGAIAARLVPTGQDAVEHSELQTITTVVTVASNEHGEFIDNGAVSISTKFAPNDLENELESGTVVVELSSVGAESASYSDDTPLKLQMSGTSIEVVSSSGIDSAEMLVAIRAAALESLAGVDTGLIPLAIKAGGTDVTAQTDVGTALSALTPASTDTSQYVDNVVGVVGLNPTGIDAFVASDSLAPVMSFTPSAGESRIASDNSPIPFALAGHGIDVAFLSDAREAQMRLEPSSGFSDATLDATDLVFTLTIPVGVFEGTGHLDSVTANIQFKPIDTESGVYVEKINSPLSLTPSSTEESGRTDSSVAGISFEGAADERYTPYRFTFQVYGPIRYINGKIDLRGFISKRWLVHD